MKNTEIENDLINERKNILEDYVAAYQQFSDFNRKRMNFLILMRSPLVILIGIIFSGILGARIGNIWSYKWFLGVGTIGGLSLYADFLITRKRIELKEEYLSSGKEAKAWGDLLQIYQKHDYDLKKALTNFTDFQGISDIIRLYKLENMVATKIEMELEKLRQKNEENGKRRFRF